MRRVEVPVEVLPLTAPRNFVTEQSASEATFAVAGFRRFFFFTPLTRRGHHVWVKRGEKVHICVRACHLNSRPKLFEQGKAELKLQVG